MVQVRVGDDDGVQLLKGHELRGAQVRGDVVGLVGGYVDPAVYEGPAVAGLQEGRGAAHLPEPAQGREAHPVLPVGYLLVYAVAHLLEEGLALVGVLAQVDAYLLDGLGRYGRCANDFGGPADLGFDKPLSDFVEYTIPEKW